jgi:hypothetical protein
MENYVLHGNRFGLDIFDDMSSFSYTINYIKRKYPDHPKFNPDVYIMSINWSWHGYDGFGEISFYKTTGQLCNKNGENDSHLTISSDSNRKQINGHHSCSLCNDQTLALMFSEILRNTKDLSATKEYGDFR